MSDIYIKRILETRQKYLQKVGDVDFEAIPSIPTKLDEYKYGLWIVIRNKTQFKIFPDGEAYFKNGVYFDRPAEVDEYSARGVGVRDTGIWWGTWGGIRYGITLDLETKYNFVVGFGSPISGSNSGCVLESSNAQDGYDKRVYGPTSVVSSAYVGEDKNRTRVSFRFRLDCQPPQDKTIVVTILQDMIELPD